MGILASHFGYLIELIPPLRLGASCATLGKQDVYINPMEALVLAAEAGLIGRTGPDAFVFPRSHPYVATQAAGRHIMGMESRIAGTITDVALLNLLGFAVAVIASRKVNDQQNTPITDQICR